MSKNKKGKVVKLKPVQQSPENYIKAQARSLPITSCLVTEDWKRVGICNVIVARRHKTGNLTAAFFLIDLFCLGVKDAHFEFNISPDDFDYVKKNSGDVKPCDYVLAHNIIYGAVAFAEEFGFKPHKSFATAQHILENDDDAIELMELEFGFNGQPYYVAGPYDDKAKIATIRNTLMRTAGKGNFTIIEDIDNDRTEDDEFGDSETDLAYNETIDKQDQARKESFESAIALFKVISKFYNKAIRTSNSKKLIKVSTIGKGYKLTEDPVRNKFNDFDDAGQESIFFTLLDLFENDEFDESISGIKEAILRYPDKAQFYNLLQGAYLYNEQTDELNDLIIETYRKFPDFIFAKVARASQLMDDGDPGPVLEVFNNKADLNELYPDRKLFNVHEAAVFHATMCLYHVAMKDIDTADVYMNVILKNDLLNVQGQTIVTKALTALGDVKLAKIKEAGFLDKEQEEASRNVT